MAVADPLWNPGGGGWVYGGNHGAVICLTGFNGRRALDNLTKCTPSHVAVVIEGIMIVAYYLRPSASGHEFLSDWGGPIMYCEDFNAKSPAWGSLTSDRRGTLLLEMISRLDLYPIVATGGTYTFINGRGNTAVLDFAFCDAATYRSLGDSRILDLESRSDHLYVEHLLRTPRPVEAKLLFKWNVKTLDTEKMKELYDANISALPADRMWEEDEVQKYLDFLQTVCEGSMAKARPPRRPTTVGGHQNSGPCVVKRTDSAAVNREPIV